MPMKEVQEKLDALGREWEGYKKTNDAAIADIKKGLSDSEQKEKLDKMEGGLQKLEKQISDLNAAVARTPSLVEDAASMDAKQYRDLMTEKLGKPISLDEAKMGIKYRDAFNKFMRKGAEISDELIQFARKTLSVDSEVGGGFFVTPELSGDITKKINESSPIRQLANKLSISSSSLKVFADVDDRTASWQGERSTRSEGTSPTVRQDEIFVHELDCNPGATQAFLDDAAVNVESWLSDYCAEAFAIAEATAFVSGSGVGRPRGILSYIDSSSTSYVYGKLQRIATDATGSITGDDLIDVQDALKEPYQKNASWLMNRLTKSVIRKVKDGTQYLWQPGLQAGAPDQLMGRPVYLAADLNTSLATGTDGLMVYGDLKAGYQIVDRVGIRVIRDIYSSKPKVIFFTTKRVGGGVKNYEAIKILKIM